MNNEKEQKICEVVDCSYVAEMCVKIKVDDIHQLKLFVCHTCKRKYFDNKVTLENE